MATGVENQKKIYRWLNTFLGDLNFQLAKPGTGNAGLGTHTIDVTTGNWENVAHSKSKPPRWLMQVDLGVAPPAAQFPSGGQDAGIGFFTSTATKATASIALRILPLLKTAPTDFDVSGDFEVAALFVFPGGLAKGSGADAISLNLGDGKLLRVLNGQRVPAPYIFAGLLGLRPRTDVKQVTIGGVPHDVPYGEVVDSLQSAIIVHPEGGAAGQIGVYDLSDDAEVDRLKADVEAAWNNAAPLNDEFDLAELEVPEDPDLLGVDPSVYRQINALLKSGKQHIMLYGPPGTGKTTLARHIASSLPGGQWTLVTGSSDWSSQDIIGGYQPVGDGNVDFVPGILLRDFDRPFIIDELNRCDIDKVIGPLFTVLSGQQTTLPYRTDIKDKNSSPYAILPRPNATASEHEFAPGPAWRIIATINSIDKASLYQMSYALSRRFGWVYVDAPSDLAGFITAFIAKTDPTAPTAGGACPLAAVWAAINVAREIGSAPIIDAIATIRKLAPGASFFGAPSAEMREAALDALDMVLLPMLDGIVLQDADNIADAMANAFELLPEQAARVKRRLQSVAI